MNANEPCNSNGGIKEVYIMQIPINLNDINFMSELNTAEAKEVKEIGGIDCVILSPTTKELYDKIKEFIKSEECGAQEYFQDLDNPQMGEICLGKIEAYKEVIKLITGNKPILFEDI